MAHKNIIYEVRDRIGWITLNRPHKLNVINDAMLRELDEVLAAAEPDLDVKVIVIKGAGSCFSAGQDLSGVETSEVMPPQPGSRLPTKRMLEAERRRNRRWEYIFNICKPTIAQVHGYCLGAGCYLSMVCDITIAAEDAIFGDRSMRMGLLPAMPLWTWLIGEKKTRELVYTGRYIDGKEAEAICLINRAVPASRLEAEVYNLARGISLSPGDALALGKDSLNANMEARGVGAAWRFTDDMQLVMQQRTSSPEEFDFYKVRAEKGLKAAIEERDAPFKSVF